MLGNDVVDLLDPESRPESFRPRFDERVFSEDERRAIAEDPDPLARRWAHWAAKEAAYKLARQIDATFVFSPGRLIAHYSPVKSRVGQRLERRGLLVLEGCGAGNEAYGRRLSLRSFETAERIHVVAVDESTDWGIVDYAVHALDAKDAINTTNTTNNTITISDGPARDASVAVRAMAVGEIGRRLGVSLDRLSIGRRGRIPVVMLDGAETSLSLSLSHHGKWIGYAMALRMDSVLSTTERPDRRQPSPAPMPVSSTPQLSPIANRATTA